MAAPVNVIPNEPQYQEDWQPPETELWSIPPVITGEPPQFIDMAVRLRQGIIMHIKMNAEWLFQNVNDNEDDVIDFSLHGDPNGIWGKLNSHSLVRATTDIYFLNRTHKDVLFLSSFKQNPN